jgi:hypothetical protein
MDITTSASDPRAISQVLPEPSRYGAQAIESQTADHEARCLAHVIRRAQVGQRRVTLEEAIPELRDLRDLLEEHLAALRAIYEEQRRALSLFLQESGAPAEELRALMQPGAPWVSALDQTRQLIRAEFLEIAASHVRARRGPR